MTQGGSYQFYDLEVRGEVLIARFKAEPPPGDPPNDTEETTRLLKEIAAEPPVRAAVFVGTPVRFGPTRPDRKDTQTTADPGPDPRAVYERTRQFLRTLVQIDKPIVSALTGDVSPPLGLTIALLSDFSVAERQIRIHDPHVLIGAVSATSAYSWPVSVGVVKAKKYLMTGDPLAADEAERIGLLTELVETGAAEARAIDLAQALTRIDPLALAHTKRALNTSLHERLTLLDATLAAARLARPL